MSNIRTKYVNRMRGLSWFLGALGLLIVVKIVRIQHFETYSPNPKKTKPMPWIEFIRRTYDKDTVWAMRGQVFANDGRVLATSVPKYDISIDPTIADSAYFRTRVDSLGMLLAQTFGQKTSEQYAEQLQTARDEGDSEVRISAKVDFFTRNKIKKWPFFRNTSKRYPYPNGGIVRTYYERNRPFNMLAERTIGGMKQNRIHSGHNGLEYTYNNELAGVSWVGMVERLRGGIRREISVDQGGMTAEAGMDIYTTLDINIQDIATSALLKQLRDKNARYGCVVVMETATGHIKAMVNLGRQPDSSYVEDDNYALKAKKDPGSTFKLAAMMAVLDRADVNLNKVYNTGRGRVDLPGDLDIVDTKPHGLLTVQQIIEQSSNVGMHLLMRDYFYREPKVFLQYLHKYKLTQKSGQDIWGEEAPVIHEYQGAGWHKYSLSKMAYGYEMDLVPMQILSFYNTIANDGHWVRPMLVQEIRKSDEVVKKINVQRASASICEAATLRKLRTMLTGVVQNGTARGPFEGCAYQVAGKTGTAQNRNEGGSYIKGRDFNTTFVGYFPANKPKYTCIVVIDRPRGLSEGALYAANIAAPVFRTISDRIYATDVTMHPPIVPKRNTLASLTSHFKSGNADDLRLIADGLNVPINAPLSGWVDAKTGKLKKKKIDGTRVPNVRGMTLRDALAVLENQGFEVAFSGVGKITQQSLEPGSEVFASRKITVFLR